MKAWQVSHEESGQRLQDFLRKRLPAGSSNREIKRQIEANHCLVNGVTERFASRKLKAEGVSSEAAGILKLLEPHGSYYLTHRLDKETSGVLLLAKTSQAETLITDAFRKRTIRKEYLALVDGFPKESEGIIENYLGKRGSFHGQTLYGKVAKEKGRLARTKWVLSKAAKQAALLTCFPETGRTHQIRVHLSGLGHPVLGDYQYGKQFRSGIRPPRMLLHAARICFEHPVTKRQMDISAPLPLDFSKVMKTLW
jgi:RluA family pseudouridine synthase